MKDKLEIFISSIWAGVAISIGAIAYLCTKQALLFPIGLLIVCAYHLNLFTGKAPYIAGISGIPKLILILFGNIVGATLMGIVFGYAKPTLIVSAMEICRSKLTEGWEIIPLAIMCNVLLFIAVDTFKNENVSHIFRTIILWMATSIFVFCGFEHCIANVFYFSVAGLFNLNVLRYLLLNILFNAIGGILIYQSFYYIIDTMVEKNEN